MHALKSLHLRVENALTKTTSTCVLSLWDRTDYLFLSLKYMEAYATISNLSERFKEERAATIVLYSSPTEHS